MSIQNELDQIKNAIYGKDVRQAIHDGIEMAYNDAATDHDNANMEVKLARGSSSTLGERLNEIDALGDNIGDDIDNITTQLAQTAKQEEVFLKSKGINVNDFDEPTRQTFLEAQGIDVNYVLGDKNVKTHNLDDNVVTQSKIFKGLPPTFLDGVKLIKQNLLDSSKFITAQIQADGTIKEVPGNYVSDYVPMIPHTTYYRLNTNVVVYALYDENKNFINRPAMLEGVTSFTTPHNAYYARFTDTNANMLSEVISIEPPTAYVPYNIGEYQLNERYSFVQAESNHLTNHLKGKKVVVLGDSLSDERIYQTTLSNRTGMSVVTGAVGGAMMSIYNTYNPNDYDKISVVSMSKAIKSGDWSDQDTAVANLSGHGSISVNELKSTDFNTVDYIVVFAGTNDFGNHQPLGADSDHTDNTFKGAINIIIDNILTAYPHIKVCFLTPIWRSRISSGDDKDTDTNPNAEGVYLIEYVDAILNITNLNKVPAFDMFRNSGINKYNANYNLRDGLHLTAEGHKLIGDKISSYMLSNF